jgi:predicted nucleotidyltransferase
MTPDGKGAVRLGTPDGSDQIAAAIVGRLVALMDGRLRLAVVIGSRAVGRARSDSDLDIVLVVEPSPDMRNWDGPTADRQRERLLQALGSTPCKVDLSVRSGDQFEDARQLFGGVEWLAEHEGRVLYHAAFETPPRRTRPRELMRRNLMRAWLDAAHRSLMAVASQPTSATPAPPRLRSPLISSSGPYVVRLSAGHDAGVQARDRCERALKQAAAAICTHYQVEMRRHDQLEVIAGRLERCSRTVADKVRRIAQRGNSPEAANDLFGEALRLVSPLEKNLPEIKRYRGDHLAWLHSSPDAFL